MAHFWVNHKFLLAFSCNPFLETDILFLATIDSNDIKLTLKYWASSPRMQPTLRQSPYDGHTFDNSLYKCSGHLKTENELR